MIIVLPKYMAEENAAGGCAFDFEGAPWRVTEGWEDVALPALETRYGGGAGGGGWHLPP